MRENIYLEIEEERARQDAKFGKQAENMAKDPFMWVAILAEEQGEFAQAMLHAADPDEVSPRFTLADARKEALQCAAVSVAICEWLDLRMNGGRSVMATFWNEQEVELVFRGAHVHVKGLVYEKCPALAVTQQHGLDGDPLNNKWRVTHIPTGMYIGWPLWDSIDDAKRVLLALAPLTDWATITEASHLSFRKRLSPLVNSISDRLREAAEDDD